MLSVEGIAKSFGPQVLFSPTTFSVGERARIGLIGPNGAGKSTFFRILVGEEHADEGEIRFPKHYRVAYMQQEWSPKPKDTVLEATLSEFGAWDQARKRLDALAHDLESEGGASAYHEAETQFYGLGGYAIEQRAKEILAGLGFEPEEFDQPARNLSGGWRIRCHIAGLLLQEADLLLLDEPTNHLDVETVVWLENFLLNYPHSVMIISHDHRLISRIATDILEFAPPSLTLWPGTLKQYESQKNIRIEQLEAAITNKQREIDRMEDFVRKFRAKATKARQAQSRLKTSNHYQEELAELKASMPVISKRPARFSLPLRQRLPKAVLEVEKCVFGYHTEKPLFDLKHLLIEAGKKIGVIGVNGVGKTTFLKTCAGELPPLSGNLKRGMGVEVGYFAQHCMEQLPREMSIFDYLSGSTEGNTISQLRGVAASLGLTANDVDKQISVLSGGEKARTTLSQILLRRPGLLLLDEPTNHLDLDACDALVKGLSDYEGTVLVVSHNRDFLDELVDFILEVRPGEAILHHGNYSDWHKKREGELSPASPKDSTLEKTHKSKDRKEQRRREAEIRNAKSADRRKLQTEFKQVEKDLDRYRKECKELEAKLCDPEQMKDPEFPQWLKRQGYLALRTEHLEEKWLELAEEIEKTE